MANWMNKRLLFDLVVQAVLKNSLSAPALVPPSPDRLCSYLRRFQGQDVSRRSVQPEKIIVHVVDQTHAVNQARSAVIEKNVCGQAQFVQSVTNFSQARI